MPSLRDWFQCDIRRFGISMHREHSYARVIHASGIHTSGTLIASGAFNRVTLHREHSGIGSIHALGAFTHWEHSGIASIHALGAFMHWGHSGIASIHELGAFNRGDRR